jgi:hypothetical protein
MMRDAVDISCDSGVSAEALIVDRDGGMTSAVVRESALSYLYACLTHYVSSSGIMMWKMYCNKQATIPTGQSGY